MSRGEVVAWIALGLTLFVGWISMRAIMGLCDATLLLLKRQVEEEADDE